MNDIKIFPIGKIENNEKAVRVVLDSKFSPGLRALAEFSHLLILWWADGCDSERDRNTLMEEQPYTKGPSELGVFALRSPERPNPLAVSTAGITYVDEAGGVVGLSYIDALDGTPVLDLKPYTPSLDRVFHPKTPDFCRHWPQSLEESGDFDWDAEFNF